MRIGVLVLPVEPWRVARDVWRRAEGLGFASAWTYDHMSWRLPGSPWYDAYATLAAAAAVTRRIRVGTLVTTPNFRHPVTTAKAAVAIDEVSGGRLDLGMGMGSGGSDARVLGDDPHCGPERADRFAEFVEILDLLLREKATTYRGRYWAAVEASMRPGCAQRPRVPFTIAAGGPRGMRLVARFADAWVTLGDPRDPAAAPYDAVRHQTRLLEDACVAEGRDPAGVRRMLLTGPGEREPLASVEAFHDLVRRYAELGVTDVLVHWPHEPYEADMKVLEAVAPGSPT